MTLKKAWGDLRGRKLRSALVLFSVAVAVFGVSAIKLVGDDFQRRATEKFNESNPPDLTVNVMQLPHVPRAALSSLNNVETVEGRAGGTARWTPAGEGRKENVAIQGLADFQYDGTLDRVRVVRGAAPQAGEILFEKSARQKYDLSVGQQVTLIGTEGERTFTISGFGENPNVLAAPVVGFASGWMTADDARSLLELDSDNRVLIRMRDTSTEAVRDGTQQRVRESLEGNEVTVLASQVRDPTSPPGQDILQALRTILLVFALFGALASGLLVVNTISTIVMEQRPQIGAMKAIGGSTRDVMKMYLVLGLLYGSLGTALGFLAGIVFTALTENARASALDEGASALRLDAETVLLVVGLGIGSCLVAAVVPSWLGARVTVREALISYGLSANFGSGWWDHLVIRLHGLPPAAMLALRNVFRQPQRAWFTLLGLAVATAMLVAVLATLNALSASIRASGAALKADLMLTFDALAEGAAVDRALAETGGIDRRELWLVTSAKTGGKSLAVTGLPPDTGIFDVSTVKEGGRWLAAGATDQAVITQRLATRRDLGVGSKLELTSGSQPARTWTVVGIVPGAGAEAMAPDGGVYAPYEAVRTLVDFPEGRGNQLYVRLDDRRREQVDAKGPALADELADAGLSNTPVKLYEQQEGTERIFVGFTLLFSLMIVIVSVVGGLGLFGTLAMNVFERRREIGVLRSVGAPTRTLLGAFLLEGLLVGLCGWGLGMVLGVPASRLLVGFFSDRLIPLEYAFPGSGALLSLAVLILLTLLASFGPALLATRIRIAEILRYA
jgi:putative ABC transport system permease protein